MARTSTPSHSWQYDLVCIDSGPAGQRAAIQAAKIWNRVALIEKRRVFGCACDWDGSNRTYSHWTNHLHTDRGLDYYLKTVFNYPTLAECYKVAALDAYNKLQEG